MKKRINGLKYDTQTAILVGIYNVGADEGRFSFTESLHFKRSGNFFIYRHGGDRNADADDITSDCWVTKPEIKPISFKEAKSWTKRNCSASKYLSLFGGKNDPNPDVCSLSSKKIMDRRLKEAYPTLIKENRM